MGRRRPRSSGPSDRYEPDKPPTVYRYRYTTVVVVLALLAVIGVATVGAFDGDLRISEELDRSVVELTAVEEINDAREENGLPPLQESEELASESRAYSAEMAAGGELEHGDVACSPGGENIAKSYWQRAVQTESGTKTHSTSEELGEALAQQWLTSEGHRENIMSTQYDIVGVGVVEQDSEVYATQRFCG